MTGVMQFSIFNFQFSDAKSLEIDGKLEIRNCNLERVQ